MPSPEEFGGGETSRSVGAAPRTASGGPDMEALKARARAIRRAQVSGAPIPDTGLAVTGMALASAPMPQHQPQPALMGTTYVDDEMELVRARFKLASYYEALIEQPAFGDDVNFDPYAAQVQHELTEWVKGRMMELTGVRNNPEGFLDDEVQLLKHLAQGLGPNGARALIALAERMLNPPVTEPSPSSSAAVDLTPDEPGSSAGFMAAAPAAAPRPTVAEQAPPQVTPAKPKRPYVRRAKVPGAPAATQATAPASEEAESEPQKRGRKRASDPLAAGKAAVAATTQPAAPEAPAGQPGVPANAVQPVPMPKGLGMSMAMEQKAGEALRNVKVIEATGAGIM